MLHNLIWKLFEWFMFSGTVGLFGIGMGPSSGEKTQAGELGAAANFGTGEGEGDILSADNFWKGILSGDPSQIAKVLGPTLSGINKRGQNQKKTMAEFGNRSGGTNASAQTVDDNTRSSIDSMIASLTGSAASALGASGSSLLSTGVSAHEAAFSAADTIHQQKSAQINDLFKSIASFAAAPFTGGASLGGEFGGMKLPGSGGGGGGNWWDNVDFPGDSSGGGLTYPAG